MCKDSNDSVARQPNLSTLLQAEREPVEEDEGLRERHAQGHEAHVLRVDRLLRLRHGVVIGDLS